MYLKSGHSGPLLRICPPEKSEWLREHHSHKHTHTTITPTPTNYTYQLVPSLGSCTLASLSMRILFRSESAVPSSPPSLEILFQSSGSNTRLLPLSARTSASVLLTDAGVQKHVQRINISATGNIDAPTRPPLAPRTPGDRLSAPPRLAGPAASAGARPRSPYEPFPTSPLLPIDRRRPSRRLPGYELRGLTPCRDRAVQTKIRLTGPRGVRATSIRPDPTPRVHHTP